MPNIPIQFIYPLHPPVSQGITSNSLTHILLLLLKKEGYHRGPGLILKPTGTTYDVDNLNHTTRDPQVRQKIQEKGNKGRIVCGNVLHATRIFNNSSCKDMPAIHNPTNRAYSPSSIPYSLEGEIVQVGQLSLQPVQASPGRLQTNRSFHVHCRPDYQQNGK